MNRLKGFLAATLTAATAISASAATFVGDRTDFRDETIYFVMTTRFYDGDPTNNVQCWDNVDKNVNDPAWRGDFKGLIDKLDYIKALGFTAIWITPVVQNGSGYDYHGYHAMDFSSVDLRYESRKSWGASQDVKFQDLINAAHAKGLKIILDIVLNHTGNFGEARLCPEFTRNQNIRNQADINSALKPDYSLLGSDYDNVQPGVQYARRLALMKNTDGKNHDTHNYWHHFGSFNWDDDTRWWAQIAGDCVDLNTENQAVANYLVDCYGEFIKMGVDGFRIDTSGHISRLTFNKNFIPQFQALAEQYKAKRNGGPFFMYGEVCARDRNAEYRGQSRLSPYFYTWKESKNYDWDTSTTSWDSQVVMEGGKGTHTNVKSVDQHAADYVGSHSDNRTSDNAFLNGNAYHTPDYSQYSGFSVIDFPMHWNFRSAAEAWGVRNDDKYYNDASYNVTYVDSHDYSPDGAPESERFAQDQSTWAENLALMFSFRGIPCIYYGSEVEFQKGKPIDKGTEIALKESGRAYYGAYLEGSVSASDFGVYTASGNVNTTLDGDLAHHIRRLNMIRAVVPALRKGQYSTQGCSGSFAFKRRYTDSNIDSYALVTISGNATFTGVENGTYTDCVTGNTINVTNGTLTANCSGKGNMRVYVLSTSKTKAPGKVGTDGKYLYASSPVAHNGNPKFTDPGTTQYYTAQDAVGSAGVKLSPAGSSFKTETLTVTVSLNDAAVSGWYKVGNGSQVTLTSGQTKTEVIGKSLKYGETTTISWGAKSADGEEYTGSATYKKVDPNAAITIHVKSSSAPNIYVWGSNNGSNVEPCGAWPGTQMSATKVVDGVTYYYVTIDDLDSVNFILNTGGSKTPDITGITGDVFYTYDGGTNAQPVTGTSVPDPVTPDPVTPSDGNYVVYFENQRNWNPVYVYSWIDDPFEEYFGKWPGKQVTETVTMNGKQYFKITIPNVKDNSKIIFNNGNGTQTDDLALKHTFIYAPDGSMTVGVNNVEVETEDAAPEFYNLQGIRVYNPGPGIYLMRKGTKTTKVNIR